MDARKADWTGRVEDDALLRGKGRFGDDVLPAGAVSAAFVRSPHAHARITGIDKAAAAGMPGVVAIVTGRDIEGQVPGSVTAARPVPGWQGKPHHAPHRPALPADRAVHVGQPVALVLAETAQQALDAAEALRVDYEPLPAAIGAAAARPGAPLVWPEAAGNIALDWSAPSDPDGGKRRAVDEAFARAAHVTKLTLHNQRIAAVSMEPRVATASYDAATGKFTLRAGTQGVASIKMQICGAMKLAPDKLRVLTDDVGGGFGMKAASYPEYVALLLAAKHTGRAVHWFSSRSEALLSDNQARDQTYTAELALAADGRFLGLRIDVLANLGAFLTGASLYCHTVHLSGCLPSLYDIACIHMTSKGFFSNELPVAPYRGAGRPEVNFLLERLIDTAAREMAVDPADIRRRNLIQPGQMPYRTFVDGVCDSGDFPAVFEKAIAAADYAGFPARRAQSEARGHRRGIGIGGFLEISGGLLEEPAAIRFPGGNRIHASIGCSPQGQGHLTVFAEVVARRLGLPASAVEIQCGDSDRDVAGMGAVASRSAMLVGSALAVTADRVIEKGRAAAAVLLQADAAAVVYANGAFSVPGSARSVSLFEVAERAGELVSQGALTETMDTLGETKTGPSFPNGCHIAEVEVDPETGGLEIVRYTAVGDVGNILNEVIVDGQVHGGVAQGLGQALMEQVVYDAESAQVLSGSLMDYAVPRADDMPAMTVLHHGVPCTTNTVGAKGVGESGTTAAPSAIVNAVIDALPPGAAADLEMPLTPEKVWRAFRPARAAG